MRLAAKRAVFGLVATLTCVSLSCLPLSCGASSAGGKSAGSADDEGDDGGQSSYGSDNSEGSNSGESSEQLDTPAAHCADGSCATCGNGLCPVGFYCDESESEPGCAWLPQCASSNDCACLEKHLSGCNCREESGGVYLTCE